MGKKDKHYIGAQGRTCGAADKQSRKNPGEIDVCHVFDRFYKADRARSRTSTGLGLAIAKELVYRMGGEIGARIEGNEFIIEIVFPIMDNRLGQ